MDVKEYTDKQKQAMQMTMFTVLDIIKVENDPYMKKFYQGYYKAYEDIINGIDTVLNDILKQRQ